MRRTLTLIVGAAMLLTACQSLPTSGPVTEFEPDLPDSASLQLQGYGPVENDSPEGIIRDFLRASAAGWSDDFQVARTYLTETARERWKPETQVQIYPNDQVPLTQREDNVVVVNSTIEAFIGADGIYHLQLPVSTETFEYQLVQDDAEQWRINALPDGVVVSQSAFHAAYQQASVSFLSPDAAALVADQRWFPRRRLASYLMQALLDGPSQSLAPAVMSAVPEGAQLPLQSVEVSSGRAHVEISGAALPDENAVRLFRWQVVSTLVQVPNVSDVTISINGSTLENAVLPSGPIWTMDTLVGVNEDGLVVSDTSGTHVVVPATVLGTNSASQATIGPTDASPIAYLSGPGVLMAVASQGGEPSRLWEADKLSAPSVDRVGWVWSAAGSTIVVGHLGANALSLPAPWDSGEQLSDIAISPDGARALLTRGGNNPSVWVAAVQRSHDGTPMGLGALTKVEAITGSVVDASWAGNAAVAVLVNQGGKKQQVLISNLSTSPEVVDAPADAKAISAGVSPQTILLQTDNQVTYARSGASWRKLTTQLTNPTYPR